MNLTKEKYWKKLIRVIITQIMTMDLKNDANIDESKNIGYELNHKKGEIKWVRMKTNKKWWEKNKKTKERPRK